MLACFEVRIREEEEHLSKLGSKSKGQVSDEWAQRGIEHLTWPFSKKFGRNFIAFALSDDAIHNQSFPKLCFE